VRSTVFREYRLSQVDTHNIHFVRLTLHAPMLRPIYAVSGELLLSAGRRDELHA
jgi:hypothetical protein